LCGKLLSFEALNPSNMASKVLAEMRERFGTFGGSVGVYRIPTRYQPQQAFKGSKPST
jgi:hypothetical protein